MSYILGIVPPKEVGDQLVKLRQKWNYTAAEPHITVKASGGLSENLSWFNKVEGIINSFEQFDITIGEVKDFSNSVLYLKITSERINDLHTKLVEATSPTQKEVLRHFELNNYIPHLTIMKHKKGYENIPLYKIKEECNVIDTNCKFKAKYVRLYELNNTYKIYKKLVDIPLHTLGES